MTNARPSLRRMVALAAAALVLGGCVGSAATVTAPASATRSPSPSPTPIATAPPPSGATVHVYFWSGAGDPCTDVVPVDRIVDAATPSAALRALVAGPTAAEKAAGYGSWFSASTADVVVGVTVRDGVAEVSFRDLRPIIPNASSSCGSGALLHSLDATLTALPGITAARYSFGGDEAAFYEWLQREPPPR